MTSRKLLRITGALAFAWMGTSAAAAPECGANTGQAASGEPIFVGGVYGEGPNGDFSAGTDAAAAYFDCVNANGGIHGRPIEYLVENDQWLPEAAAQAAAKLVVNTPTVALVGNSSAMEASVNAGFYAENGIMAMTAVCATSECYESPNTVATNQGPLASGLGAAQYALEELGAQNLACITLFFPNGGGWACEGVSAYMKENGADGFPAYINTASMDVNSVVLEALAGGADSAVVILPAGLAVAVLKAAEEQDLGDVMHWLSATPLYDESVPAALGSYWHDKVYVNTELAPFQNDGPDMQNWRAVMDAYARPEDPRDTFAQSGYLSAKFFTEALLGMDPADVDDRAKVTEAIRAISGKSTDLMCTDYYVGSGERHMPNTAGYMVKVVDGGFEIVRDCFQYNSSIIDSYEANRP